MFEFYQFPWKTLNGRSAGINGLELAGGVCQLLDQIAEMQKPGVSEMVWSRAILSPRELEIYYAIASDEQRMSWLFQMGAAKDAVRAYSRRQGHELSPCDIEIDLMPGDIGVSGAWTTELHPPRVAVAFDHGIAVGAGAAQPVAVAIERVSRDAAPSSASFLPEEREWIERLKDPSEWTARATAAKRAVAKWMRPQQEEDPAYWASMAILRLDETAGELSVADPGMAVNAEDTVTVYTHRDGDRIVAVAMK
jgi:hypothetical protein